VLGAIGVVDSKSEFPAVASSLGYVKVDPAAEKPAVEGVAASRGWLCPGELDAMCLCDE
jgi:hypothetical protein